MHLVCCLIIWLFLATPASAQTVSLSIWPPLLEAVIKPGKSITQVFKLQNLGDDTVIDSRVVPFEPTDEFGNIRLSDTPNPALSYFSLQNADLKLTAKFPLKAGQTQELVLKIRVPEEALDGDHYFTFLFESETEGLMAGSGALTQGTIAANILLTVSQTGVLNPTAKIEEFFVTSGSDPEVRQGLTLLDSFDPINFILKVRNTSTTRFKAEGFITIKNLFGRQIATLALREDNVLALSSRQLTPEVKSADTSGVSVWDPVFPLGRYTATATVTPQNTQNTVSQTISFWVLPYKAILILAALFLLAHPKGGRKLLQRKFFHRL